ncbi:pol-like protein ENS-3 [Grus japonensis]|uniref:Pol-like protein ENS-3 n=1 Tax=Grus japonensis TaxID=30415 RepID=A0ABC9YD38_GRUJA
MLCSGQQQLRVEYYYSIFYNQSLDATIRQAYRLAKLENCMYLCSVDHLAIPDEKKRTDWTPAHTDLLIGDSIGPSPAIGRIGKWCLKCGREEEEDLELIVTPWQRLGEGPDPDRNDLQAVLDTLSDDTVTEIQE